MLLLHDELVECLRIPSSMTILCQALEGGLRQSIFQQGLQLPDGFLTNLMRGLKLSISQAIQLTFALTKSQYRLLSQDAIKHFALLLPHLSSPISINEVRDDVLMGIAQLFQATEVSSLSDSFFPPTLAIHVSLSLSLSLSLCMVSKWSDVCN